MTAREHIQERLRSPDVTVVCDTLRELGRTDQRDLEPLVAPLLQHADADVRLIALKTLALSWRLAPYEPIAKQMAFQDQAPSVRASALVFWALYHTDQADDTVLAWLQAVAIDASNATAVREAAILGSLYVLGYPRDHVPAARFHAADLEGQQLWRLLADAYLRRSRSVPPDVATLAGSSAPLAHAATDPVIEGLRSSDEDEMVHAVVVAGKTGRSELRDAIEPFLTSPNEAMREAAIKTLTFYWQIPEHRATAMRLARTEPDPDEGVRAAATMGLSKYRDDEALEMLLAIALDRQEDERVRDAAYVGSLVVAGISIRDFPTPARTPGFEEKADWRLLANLLRQRPNTKIPERLQQLATRGA